MADEKLAELEAIAAVKDLIGDWDWAEISRELAAGSLPRDYERPILQAVAVLARVELLLKT